MVDRTALRELFNQAISLPPESRGRFLARVCGDNVDLRAKVERILAFDPDRGFSTRCSSAGRSLQLPSFKIGPGLMTEWDVSSGHAFLQMESTSGNIWMLDHADR